MILLMLSGLLDQKATNILCFFFTKSPTALSRKTNPSFMEEDEQRIQFKTERATRIVAGLQCARLAALIG